MYVVKYSFDWVDGTTPNPFTMGMLVSVLGGITPSIMKSEERVTGISWESIGGMEDVKAQLRKVRNTTSLDECLMDSTLNGRSNTRNSLNDSI